MVKNTTIYYGKEYGLVYSSTVWDKINVYADIINKIFGDYNHGKTRVKLQQMRNLVLIDHNTTNNKTTHNIYVKKPYDKLVRRTK
jgi:hypothetical protein